MRSVDGVVQAVELSVNVPFGELQQLLGRALVGIHTMRDEHFGIGVVEFMAAGYVRAQMHACIQHTPSNLTLAADSGGPKSDIVVSHHGRRTGWLASTEQQCVYDVT